MNDTHPTVSLTASPLLHRFNRLLLIAALLVLIGYFLVYVVYAVNLMNFPFDYDQGEGFELVDTIMFSQGQWPYQNTDTYPFYSSNYPPLFHVIGVPFVWLFGPAYWYMRLLSFVGTLVTATAIGYAVYRDGLLRESRGHKYIALLSGLAFLASNMVYHVGPLVRQHMTMVMFETLAVVILAHANEIEDTRKRRRTLILGLGLLIAGGYTKQLAAITAIAVLMWLFIRQPRRAIIYGIGFAVVGVAIFGFLYIATNGEWWRQTIVANVNTFYPDQAIGLFRLWFSLHGFLIVPALLYMIYEFYFDRLSVYSVWFIAATVLGGVGSGAWGAGDSYFATSIAAMCILSGLFASRTLSGAWRFRENYLSRLLITPFRPFAHQIFAAGLIAIPLLYLGYGRAVLHLPTQGAIFSEVADVLGLEANAVNGFYDSAGRIAGGYANIGHLVTQDDIAAGWEIVAMMRAADGPVLSEEAGFNLMAGRDVITNPTQLLNLWRAGLFDGTELIGMIENREFAFIVLRAQFYPPEVLVAISEHYTFDHEIHMNGFDYIILIPRTEPAVVRSP